MIKKKTHFLFFFELLILSIQLPSINNYEVKYFHCNNRIYSDFNGLSQSQLQSLCVSINQDNRIVLLLTNTNYFSPYTEISNDFFSFQCIYSKIPCEYNIVISIYSNSGYIAIKTSDYYNHNNITLSKINNTINIMLHELKSSNYYEAFDIGIKTLQHILYYNESIIENTPIAVKNFYSDNSASFGFFSIFIFIICPIICCILIIYFIYSKNNETREENEFIPNAIHIHLCQLENLIKQISMNSPPIISVNKCLICMKPISYQGTTGQFFEMRTFDNPPSYQNPQTFSYSNDQENTRFACQHVYHSSCLQIHQLTFCLMCNGNPSGREIISNTHNSQVLSEGHIKTFIQNLNFIYPQGELNAYAENYPNEYNMFNITLLLCLSSSWGINEPTTVINNTYNTYNYNYSNDVYGQNSNDIEGHYSPGIEMEKGVYQPPVMNERKSNQPISVETGRFGALNEGNELVINEGNYGNVQVNEGNYGNVQVNEGNFGNVEVNEGNFGNVEVNEGSFDGGSVEGGDF